MNEKVPFFVCNSSASSSQHQANRTLTDWTVVYFPANRRMITIEYGSKWLFVCQYEEKVLILHG